MCIGFFGGNSTKATSGINGALTRTQVDHEIRDSVQQFYADTLKSARDKARPELIKVLTYKSASAIEWLQEVFSLDLTLVSRLGYVLRAIPCVLGGSNSLLLTFMGNLEVIHTHVPTVVMMQSFPEWPSHMLSCKGWRNSQRPNQIV